jgi:hypothetical protein
MSVAETEIHAEQETKSVWDASFDADEQTLLKAEDSEAWHGVTGLLVFLASCGVVLALFTLLLISLIQL